MKKLLTVLLTFCMLINMLPIIASADTTPAVSVGALNVYENKIGASTAASIIIKGLTYSFQVTVNNLTSAAVNPKVKVYEVHDTGDIFIGSSNISINANSTRIANVGPWIPSFDGNCILKAVVESEDGSAVLAEGIPKTVTVMDSKTETVGGYTFTVSTGGDLIKVTNADGSEASGEVVIPETVGGTPVVMVLQSKDVFYSHREVTKITFPGTLTSIQNPINSMSPSGAFQGCVALEEIVFANGGTATLKIGDYAFAGLKALKTVTLPTDRPTTIGLDMNGRTFYGCTALEDINLAESKVTAIYSNSFNGCTALTSVTLPSALLELQCNSANGGAFVGCTNLETVTFLEGGTAELKIGMQTFYNLPNLRSVTFPKGRALNLGNRVFEGCTALTAVNFSECNVKAIGTTSFKNTALTDATIMNPEADITANAFEGTTRLTLHGWYGSKAQACAASPNVVFVALDDLGDYVTDGMFVVTHEGELVDYLGHGKEVTIPVSANSQAITTIGSYALKAHTDVTYLNIEAQITELADYVFQGFNALLSITMPDSVKTIGLSAFEGCAALQRMSFSENSKLAVIGERAFYNATSLQYVDLPNSLTTIGRYAFYSAGLSYMELPESVTDIGDYAFNKSSLIEFKMSSNPATLGAYLFRDCTRLNNVTLPEGLTAIGMLWFSGCTALTQIDIPDTVTSIGNQAFTGSGLTSITIPSGVTVVTTALNGAPRLESVAFLGNITEIQGSAFTGCSSLKAIDIPDTVTTIGASALSNCTSLKEVVIPGGVTSVGNAAFAGCTALEALVIPASVTSVGTNLINNCDKNKLVVYVERGSAAASSPNISASFGTLRFPDFSIKLEVKGAEGNLKSDAFTVLRGAAVSYGLTNEVKPYQVSVLDALVIAHRTMYGWAPGMLGGELVFDGNGQITKLFDVETNNAGFTLNGSPLPISDAASIPLKDNDELLLFTGKTSDGNDQGIAWFEFGGTKKTSIIFALNRSYELTLKTAGGPVTNIPVYALDSNGAPSGEPLGITNSEGKVNITFTGAAGTRAIAGVDALGRYFFSSLTVTVYEPDLTLQALTLTAIPGFDISSVLSNGWTAGAFIQADASGNDVTAGFDPAHDRYNVYVNANIKSLRFSSINLHNLNNAGLKKLSVYLGESSVPLNGADNLIPDANGAYIIPAFDFTGNEMALRLVVSFSENGQDFGQVYDINIVRDMGEMAPYAGILDIKGINRTSISSVYKRGSASASIYYDKGMTTATLEVKVQDGTDIYLKESDEETGTKQDAASGPVMENGRQVVTYRLTLNDFTKSYIIVAIRGAAESSLTISSFRAKTVLDGVFTPDRVAGYMPAPGQFASLASDPGSTLIATTAWNKFYSLGGFGGYVDYYYDEPIMNDPHNPYGVDFIVYGNSFGAGMGGEAAGVKVSYDGVTWYDLAGQRHYELTSYYDTTMLLDGSTTEGFLITRSGENGYAGGYPTKVAFGYADVASCSENLSAEGTYYVNARAGNPYRSATDAMVLGDGFDLGWAVDKTGKPVELPHGIRYIRVQNAVDVPENGSFGEVSTEIGTVTRVNPDTQLSGVGVANAPAALTINGAAISSLTPILSVNGGKVTYYELNLNKLSDTANVYVRGAAGDTIYVNAERYVGTADYTGLLDGNGGRTVRVIVQNGNKEPRVYVIRCFNGGDPAANADLGSLTLTPGDVAMSQSGGIYTGTVENNVLNIALRASALNPSAVIRLNGTVLAQNQSSTSLPVAVGTNSFTLTVTSMDGSVVKTYPIIIIRKAGDMPANTITVSFTFTGDTIHYIANPDDRYKPGTSTGPHNPRTWIARTNVTVPKGSTVKYVTDMMLMNAGIDFHTVGGTYIDYVQIPGTEPPEYLGEFDNGPKSGWMYKHNNYIAGQGYADRVLKDGDTVAWFYTDDYTKETAYEGGWDTVKSGPASIAEEDVYPGNPGRDAVNSGSTLSPEAAVFNGTAAAVVSADDIKDAIANVKTSGSHSIVIAPEIAGTAKKVTVEVPKSSLASVGSQTSADIVVKTPAGSVTIPNGTISSIVSRASGSSITVGLETVDNSTLTEAQKKSVGDNPVFDISITSGGKNISSFGGGSITLSLPYTLKDGQDPGNVTAWYLNDEGRLEEIACAYDKTTGLATFTTVHLSYYVVGYSEAWQNPFTDVKPADWFYREMAFAAQNGLFSGTTPTTFSPNVLMTRAMLVTVLYRIEGSPADAGENNFKDVKSGEWYTDAVIWANANGIAEGYGNGLFGANDSMTREQIATILYKYAKLKGCDITKTADLKAYTDASGISGWAQTAMRWANAQGLINGRTVTTLVPGGSATRAEVAVILTRFIENIIK